MAVLHPPVRIELGDLTLVPAGTVSVAALDSAIERSCAHLEPWMPWASGHGLDETRGFVARSAASWDTGEEYVYAVVTATGAPIGSVGLHRRIGEGGFEIGYWVHADHVRRGVTTRAVEAVVRAAFALPGVDRVEIHHDEANVASAGVPPRVGFRGAGRTAKEPLAPAETHVQVVWRLTREDYLARDAVYA